MRTRDLEDQLMAAAVDPRLAVLRRARTLARLRAAGLSDMTLSTLLPDFAVQVEQVARGSSLPVGLTIAD